MSMCFVMAWLTGFWARRSAAWLLMCNIVGSDIPSWSSESSRHNQTSSLEVSTAAMYSTWVEEVTTVLCCFNDQDTAPPEYNNVYLEMDQQVRKSLAQSTSLYPTSSDSPIVYIMQ